MDPKVIILRDHTEESIQRFLNIPGCRIVFAKSAQDIDPADCEDAEILVGSADPELVARMPRLRFLQLFSAGADGYSWLPERVVLANAYGAYGESVAEHLLTASLMVMKRMPTYLKKQEEQCWDQSDDVGFIEGANVLSVGMGAIGTTFLRKASALGAACFGVRRTLHDRPAFVERLVTPDQMDDLLPDMDIVALSLPGTDEVTGMFDERRLRLMKPSAVILNAGRGNSIVIDDLIRVLESGHLKAACLDVMDPEPLPKGHPLWTAPRVYITPHVSGGFRSGINYPRVINTVVKNLTLVLQGEPPIHIVDRKMGY